MNKDTKAKENTDNEPTDNESPEEKKSTPENPPETSASESTPSEPPKTSASVIIVGVILTLLVIVCLQVDDWSRDWTTNFAETSEEADDINLQPVVSKLSPEKMADLVTKKMGKATRWTVSKPEKQDDGSYEIKLIHKTFILGFKDDVVVTVQSADSGSRMTVNSQSRIGKGDLGQNPRNIKELVSLVRIALAETKIQDE